MIARTFRGAARPRWIIWYAISLHAIWGVCLLVSPSAIGVTAVHGSAHITDSRFPLAIVLITVALLAARGLNAMTSGPSPLSLALLIPQQIVLALSAAGAFQAVISGSFADGVHHPRAFIFADQVPALLAFIFHTLAVIHLHYYKIREQ